MNGEDNEVWANEEEEEPKSRRVVNEGKREGHEENWEEREELDTDVVFEGIVEYLRREQTVKKGERYYWIFIHSLMTFATKGVWLMLLVGYWGWKAWKYAETHKEVTKTLKVKETEDGE